MTTDNEIDKALEALDELNERFGIEDERQAGIYFRQVRQALKDRAGQAVDVEEISPWVFALTEDLIEELFGQPNDNGQFEVDSGNIQHLVWQFKAHYDEIKTPPTGWRDVESAPKDGTKILTYSPANLKNPVCKSCRYPQIDVDFWKKNESYNGWWCEYPEAKHTHWMPLPPPPTTEGEE